MIVLDTNVVSEIMQPAPERSVRNWLGQHDLDLLWLTSVTVFEIRFGIETLAQGRKRSQIMAAFELLLNEKLQGRVLSFDRAAAEVAAEFAARRRAMGRPVEIRDIEIAGIAAARRATLVTRNVRDFEGLGLKIENPWVDK
jgi:toxin FitB